MDRRMQKTRDSIFNAFSALLTQKRYSRITVQDIIDEANIGRSTFYSHFETKDDLLKALCSDIFEHVFGEELISESSHDFSAINDGFQDKITHILYHLRDSQREIKGILSSEGEELFLSAFKSHLGLLVSNSIQSCNFDDIPKEYIENHMTGSFVETVKWWMKNDMAQSPEEINRCFMAVIPTGILL